MGEDACLLSGSRPASQRATKDLDALRRQRALCEDGPQHRKMERFPRVLHNEM